jgi:hypothetical protein
MQLGHARLRTNWTVREVKAKRNKYADGRTELLGFLWYGAELPNVNIEKVKGRYIVHIGRKTIDTHLTMLSAITCGEWETRIRQGYFPKINPF